MIQLFLIVGVLIALIYYYGIKPMSYWRERGVNQTSKAWFLGDNWRNMLHLESNPDMIVRIYNAFPRARYVGMCQFNLPTLVIKDPELIKQICVKDFDHFVDHRLFFPEEIEPLFSKNLFALTGESWRNMRPILTPTFTSSKMKNMFEFMSECAQDFNEHFLKQKGNIIDVEMKDAYSRYSNDVIATTAFGFKINSLENRTNEFYTMGKKMTTFNALLKLKFFLYILIPNIMSLFKIGLFDPSANEFFIKLINDNVETRKKNKIERQDMLHLLIEAQKQRKQIIDQDPGKNEKEMTNLDIAAQAMIFFFAGFEIISTVMCFMAYELAVNPDIQKTLREEIEETTKECGGTINYEALSKMKYLDMVVSETLRKWGGPFQDRVCTKPYTIPAVTPDEKPLHLKKGDVLLLPIYALHHDPALYPEPEKFIPERFSEDNKNNINPFAYIPFGIGPRSCIGNRFALLEIKVIMFHVLSNFEIVPTSKTVIPLQLSKTQFNVMPDGGFPLGLKRLVK